MALLSYGLGEGLAYRHDFNADMNRAQNNELLDQQAKINAENRAAILGSQLQAKHLETTWDNQQLKAYVEAQTKEIGKFVGENPDYAMNPLLQSKYQQMMNGLTDNEYVRNSMNANTNYGLLTKYIADNPGSEAHPDIQAQLQAYDNYNKTGSTDGISSNGKKYVFAAPDTFDPTVSIGAVYGKLKPEEKYVGGHGLGATETKVSDQALKATAASMLTGAEGYKYQRAWKNMTDAQKSFYNNDPVEWIATVGRGYTGSSVDAGTYFAPRASSGEGDGSGADGKAPAWSPWQHDYYRLQQSQTPMYLPNVGKMIPMVDGKIQIEGDLKVPIAGADGTVSYIPLSGYNGQLVDAKVIGRTQLMDGVPYTQVQVRVPMNDAMVKGDKPLFKDLSWGLGSWEGDGADDVAEIDAYKPVASFARDKDGKLMTDENDTPYALITTYVRVPTDPVNQRNYDVNETTPAIAVKGEDIRQNNFTQNQAAAVGAAMGLDVSNMQYSSSTGQYYAPDPKGVFQPIPLE